MLIQYNAFDVSAQPLLKGSIVDETTNEALAFATIYLNNTSIGTNSDNNGEFEFQIPSGSHEVIVQYIGYHPINFLIDTENLALTYKCKLLKETQELATVKITGKRDKEWYENLKTFKRNFLGTSENASNCEILNEKALIIDYAPNTAMLSVIAKEPLLILNPALGYTLEYNLVEFTYQMRQGKVFFAGYPFFKMNEVAQRKVKQIEKNRSKAYSGSLPHLIRSLLDDKVQEEGFRVMRLYRMPNPDRPSDSIIQVARKMFLHGDLSQNAKDSIRNNVLTKSRLAKIIDMLDTTALSTKDLITENGEDFYLETNSLLQVVFKREKEESNYLLYSKAKKRGPQTSILHIISGREKLNLSGDISNPANILVEGYMAWEKVGDLMPLNYKEAY